MGASRIGSGQIVARLALGVPLALLVLAFPSLVNAYWLTVAILALFYAIVAASWALLAGYAGQFSFGHMAFVSLGAYTSGLLVMSILGGALLPLLEGHVADRIGVQHAFFIPVLCYLFIAAFFAITSV